MSTPETQRTVACGTWAEKEARQTIRDACSAYNQAAERYRDQRRRFGVMVVLASPFAVVLTALQQHYFPAESDFRAAGQLVFLVAAVATGFLRLGRSHEGWIANRLRAEVLRREEFLVVARVGPYLTSTESALGSHVDARLLRVRSAGSDILDLLDLEDAESGQWRHRLEDAHGDGTGAPVSDLQGAMRFYLDQRLDEQRRYFEREGQSKRRWDRGYERVVRAVMLLAVVLSAIQVTALWSSHHGPLGAGPHVQSRLLDAIDVLSLILPPIAAAAVALRALFETHRLAGSYANQAHGLGRIQARFLELQSQIDLGRPETADLGFKRLVLQTEESLAAELRNWWMILRPQRPAAGP